MTSSEKNLVSLIVALVLIMTGYYVTTTIYVMQAKQAAGKTYTMQVCSQMAQGSDYLRVKACGDAQEQYDLEYICNGDTADSGCRVEEK